MSSSLSVTYLNVADTQEAQVQTPALREPVPFCGLGSDEEKTYRVAVHSMPQLWTLSSV